MKLINEFLSLFYKDEPVKKFKGVTLVDDRHVSPITVMIDDVPVGQLVHRVRSDKSGYWYFRLTAHDQMLGPLGLREIADEIESLPTFDEV
jgi:hypothetical protein